MGVRVSLSACLSNRVGVFCVCVEYSYYMNAWWVISTRQLLTTVSYRQTYKHDGFVCMKLLFVYTLWKLSGLHNHQACMQVRIFYIVRRPAPREIAADSPTTRRLSDAYVHGTHSAATGRRRQFCVLSADFIGAMVNFFHRRRRRRQRQRQRRRRRCKQTSARFFSVRSNLISGQSRP